MENSTRYEVVFEGGLLSGFTSQAAREGIAKANLMSPLKAAGINFDGSPVVLYSSTSKTMAFTALRKFKGAGLDCWVRKKTEAPIAARAVRQSGLMSYAIIMLLVFLSIMVISHFIRN
jgi:hypothetical protein